ncbi:phage minor tail protein L [Pectobacterium aroidearum]|uniref:Phage minor tail protein L n=1 Tax=Pectobacterium aroidearum TaxID=1201031 RepID=A0ABR5ZJK6_9GAMM|nr:phage minor tail protein L [Pectobacterium aroidearum]MBA5234744.1 phage minor tail protein L [Pectobacterium aroidearum]MBA5739923.1 phage minor tail protein L [Pectobacterium aroidearum]
MSITSTLQKLEPGAPVDLIEVDCTAFGGDVLYFHNYALPYTAAELLAAGDDIDSLPAKPIFWQGIKYSAWPSQITGGGASADGSSIRPKLTVGNPDYAISRLCDEFQNLLLAKVTVHHTFAEFLDAENFLDGNPNANPETETLDVWYIGNKTNDNETSVEFSLQSPADVQNQKFPQRQMTSRCEWCMRGQYRMANCGYTGTNYFDKDGNPVDNPAADECAGTVSACKLRWGPDSELPHGGFVAVSLIRI